MPNLAAKSKRADFRIKTTVKVTEVMDLDIRLRCKEKGCVTRNPHVKYESPITYHKKIFQMLVLRSRSNPKVKVIWSKMKEKIQRSCHKKSSNEI
jgi:hypothetical protein